MVPEDDRAMDDGVTDGTVSMCVPDATAAPATSADASTKTVPTRVEIGYDTILTVAISFWTTLAPSARVGLGADRADTPRRQQWSR